MGGDLEFQICWRMDFLVVALNLGQERKPLRQPIWPELWRKLARRRGLGRHTCPGCHCVTQGRAVPAQSEVWRRMGSTGNGATPWAAGRKDGRALACLHHGELSLPSRKRGQGTNNMDTACGTSTGTGTLFPGVRPQQGVGARNKDGIPVSGGN